MTGELAPSDAVVALRSFPRRFREVLDAASRDDPAPPERIAQVVAHVAAAGAALAARGEAVRRALAGGAGPAPVPVAGPTGADAALDLLTLEAGALADRVEHLGAAGWDAAPDALEHLRAAVDEAASHLRAATRLTGPAAG